MPQPEGRTYAIDPYLTNLAVAMIPGMKGFVGMQVFPNITTRSRRFKYWEWDASEFNRLEMKDLANAEPPPLGGFGAPEGKDGSIKKKGVGTFWTDEDLAEAETGVDSGLGGGAAYERRKVRYVTQQGLLQMELEVASLIRGSAWTRIEQGVAANPGAGEFIQWDDDASTPIAQLKDIIRRMEFETGVKPNTMLIPGVALDKVLEHPDLLSRVVSGGNNDRPAKFSVQALADLLGIERIIETASVHNVAKEGKPKDMRYTWGTDVWIGYVAPGGADVDPEAPSAGYRFSWGGMNGYGPEPFSAAAAESGGEGLFINRFTAQRPAGYYAESYLFTTPKIVATNLGVLLKNVVPTPSWAAV